MCLWAKRTNSRNIAENFPKRLLRQSGRKLQPAGKRTFPCNLIPSFPHTPHLYPVIDTNQPAYKQPASHPACPLPYKTDTRKEGSQSYRQAPYHPSRHIPHNNSCCEDTENLHPHIPLYNVHQHTPLSKPYQLVNQSYRTSLYQTNLQQFKYSNFFAFLQISQNRKNGDCHHFLLSLFIGPFS